MYNMLIGISTEIERIKVEIEKRKYPNQHYFSLIMILLMLGNNEYKSNIEPEDSLEISFNSLISNQVKSKSK